MSFFFFFFFSSRRRHTRSDRDWSSDVCSSDLTDHKHPVNQAHYEDSTFSQRLADRVASVIGSWPFIIGQSVLMVIWVYLNVWAIFIAHWDPYPFILLNLVLSFQATYAGPI